MIVITGGQLSVAQITAIAHRREAVSLDPIALARARASWELAQSWEGPIYGRSTGVGANRDVELAATDEQAVALLRSHATSAGPLRSPERVRAMLAVRLSQLAAGGSGASDQILAALLQMLTVDALPPVREWGSVGTADLPALAVTGLALAGELPTNPPLPPIALGNGDVLPLLSSNAGAVGDAALAVGSLQELVAAAVVVAALGLVAVRGNVEAFDPAVESVSPFPGVRQVCATVRELVSGAGPPARIQDPFALRTLPQVQGALLDRVAELDSVVVAMANAPSENPVLLPGVGVAHHGGFHAAYLAQALDAVRSALAQAAQLSLARITMYGEPAVTGLAPFLADGSAGASGTMMVEYVAASALGELRAAAVPAGTQSVMLSRGVEEDASFASLAARQALDTVPAYRVLLGCELVSAMRCLRMSGVAVPGALTDLVNACAALPDDLVDRDLSEDVAIATALLPALAGGQTMSSRGRSSSA